MVIRRPARLRASRALVAGVLIASLTLVGAAQSTVAYTIVKQWGRIGAWTFTDTDTQPGAECWQGYDAVTGPIAGINVHPPVVYARDRTSGVDRQKITISGVIQQYTRPSWHYIYSYAKLHGRATDTTPLTFTYDMLGVGMPGTTRAQITINWWSKDGTTKVGAVTLRVQYYLLDPVGGPVDVLISCGP